MRILFVSQWFDPEPAFKGLPFARELVRLGHRVQVLTGFPNYPGGKVYDGYRIRPLQREVCDGIPVLRVPLYPSHDRSALRRVANYASFAGSAAVLGTILADRADVAYVYHPPATVGLAALALRALRGIPFVYDIQDLWPDTLRATGMLRSGLVLRLVDLWCRMVYAAASRIAVLSPGFRDVLIRRGVPAQKVEVVYNWCDERQVPRAGRDDDLARELGLAGRFNVVFAGTMGAAQGLEAVLRAAREVAATLPAAQFVFVGGGTEVTRLQKLAGEMELANVRFLPRRPVSEIGAVLNLADALLVHLRDDPLFEITIPSKTQAYLATGRPILMAVKGDAARLVECAGAGVCCAPEDPAALARAVVALAELSPGERSAMGERGRAFYERELSMSSGVRRFERLLAAACGTRQNEGERR